MKSEKTGSMVPVILKSDEFNKGYIEGPVTIIQGKVAGFSISKTGSDPNMEFSNEAKGSEFLNRHTNPLIIIDGMTDGSLSNVDSE